MLSISRKKACHKNLPTYHSPSRFSGGTCSRLTCSDNQSVLAQTFLITKSLPLTQMLLREQVQKWKKACLNKTLAQQISCRHRGRNSRLSTAARLETTLSHPSAPSHDLLAETIKKNKPKMAYIKPNGNELCRVFL